MAQRFGPPPPSLRRRIESLTDARALERIASALLQPTGLELLKKLAARGKAAPKSRRKAFRTLPEGPVSGGGRRRPRRLAPLRYPD
jgi:hypothetical protein